MHLFLSTVPQNVVIPCIGSSFVFGFTSLRTYSFISCHRFSIGFRLRWRFPPIHFIVINPFPSVQRCTFRIIVMHKFVAIWVHILDER